MNAKLTIIAAALALSFAPGAYAQTSSSSSGSSGQGGQSQQSSQKQQMEQQYKAAMEKCNGMKANAKDICKAEADGQKNIAEAQAKATESDTPKNRFDLEQAKADAQYKVANARCNDQVGDAKKACQLEAKATQDLAIAQAKKQSQTSTGSSGTGGSSASGDSSAGQTTSPSSQQPQGQSR
jgi:hypothetical protein